MPEVKIQLTLQDDVVFSERSASQGAHACLAYVPGSALLGWVASRLYARLLLEDAWLVFHSGKVRFGNGLPVAGNGLAVLPMPLCWHYEKATDWKHGGRILADRVFNASQESGDTGKQLKQLRDGFVTSDGLLHRPAKTLNMKTAINPQTGRAADAQLFGYEALQAGQSFTATLEADKDVPEALFRKVLEACVGLMHLGRSRSAQYGRVVGKLSDENVPVSEVRPATRDLVFWLLSDMAIERHGQPILKPEPSDLGLPAGELVLPRSLVRSRRYAPFNGKRRAPDLERQVICAGSILCFKMNEPVLPDSLPGSYGMFRECGLGVVLINSPLLESEHPVFQAEKGIEHHADASRPSHPLAQWLLKQGSQARANRDIRDLADEWFAELADLYETASSLAAQPVGPGKSQWGRVREVAMQAGNRDDLRDQLFGGSGVCKAKNNEDWTCTGSSRDGGFVSFRDWLIGKFDTASADDLPHLLSLLAQQASDYVASRKETV